MTDKPSIKNLRILILEDSPADSEMMVHEIRAAGIKIDSRRVDCEDSFSAALDDFSPDIILSDYSLPAYDGASALKLALEKAPGVPFIFVTGALGEERAVDLLKNGATDFVLKDRLPRLPLCVTRALEEVDEKRRREQAEQRVRQRTTDLAETVKSLLDEIAQRQKAEEELRRINEQLNSRAAQLRALAGELTMAEQRERKRLSRILHDGLQQHLAAIKLQFGLISDALAGKKLKQAVAKIDNMLAESMQMSRSLSADLSPPVLHEGGLSSGLRWLAQWMMDHHALRVDLSVDKIPDIPEDMTILLFESIRELLFNAVKHAKVTMARVRAEQMNGAGVRICVSDEGIGFDPSRLTPAGDACGGFGLFSIRERIGLIGGQLDINSAPGEGSRFTITVLNAQADREMRSKGKSAISTNYIRVGPGMSDTGRPALERG